jgi:hypothetical protein
MWTCEAARDLTAQGDAVWGWVSIESAIYAKSTVLPCADSAYFRICQILTQ